MILTEEGLSMSNGPVLTWRCTACGYIHRGPEPPEECPICGAPKSDFEPYVEKMTATPVPPANKWRCLNCGYIHEGPEPPAACPVCGALSDRFESIMEHAAVTGQERSLKVIIVGAGIAGISAAESMLSASPGTEITIISKEDRLPYYRLNLTRYIAGEVTQEMLPLHPEAWYQEKGINLLMKTEVSDIQLAKNSVTLKNDQNLPYERLILTVGSHPFIPALPGVHLEGVTSLRTYENADYILNKSLKGARCVCIGGGLLGLETAGGLAKRGVDVTLLEGHDWLLPRQLNRRASELLMSRVKEIGIKLRTRSRTKELIGDEHVGAVVLEDGTQIPADLVIIATGVRSNSYLARLSGLEVNNGVVVDNTLKSSHPVVYAAGDVAEHRGTVYGVWGPSQYMGSIAGMNVAGAKAEFGGIPRSNTLKVLGINLFSIGLISPEDASYPVLEHEEGGAYYCFIFRDNFLAGVIKGDPFA